MWNGCMFAYAFQGTTLYRLGDFKLRFESYIYIPRQINIICLFIVRVDIRTKIRWSMMDACSEDTKNDW